MVTKLHAVCKYEKRLMILQKRTSLKRALFSFFVYRKEHITLMCESSFHKAKKDAPQDAQLAEPNSIATQYRSCAEIAHPRNLFAL